jgi:NADH-quinone oxidoreductase subunit N
LGVEEKKERGTKNLDLLYLALVCLVSAYLMFQFYVALVNLDVESTRLFNGTYHIYPFSVCVKAFIAFLYFVFFILSYFVSPFWVYYSFEFVLLLYISMIAMFAMVGANDFFLIFLALEVQTLVVVLVASYQARERRSVEAGLKYFIMSAFFSGIYLFGVSLVYVIFGTTDFHTILMLTEGNTTGSVIRDNLFIFSFIFILSTLLFKLGVVPYHYWIPDLYRGSHILVTGFLAVLSKVAIIIVTFRVLTNVFLHFFTDVSIFLYVIAIASMFLGNFGAMYENDLRKFLGYTSINNFGTMLLGLAIGGDLGITAAFFFIITYLFSNLIFLIPVLGVVIKEPKEDENSREVLEEGQYYFLSSLEDFGGMYKNNKMLSFGLILALFGLMAVPPLIYFYGKLGLLKACLGFEQYFAFAALTISSLFSAYYYLKIIRLIFLDRETNNKSYFFYSKVLGFMFYLFSVCSLIFVYNPEVFHTIYGTIWALFGWEIRSS